MNGRSLLDPNPYPWLAGACPLCKDVKSACCLGEFDPERFLGEFEPEWVSLLRPKPYPWLAGDCPLCNDEKSPRGDLEPIFGTEIFWDDV